jgi:predicted dehydrogenase
MQIGRKNYMTTNDIKAGIIGSGGFARGVALPGFAMARGVEPIAVYDKEPEAAQLAAQICDGLRVMSSLEELLSQDLDLVYISLPPGFLYDVTRAVIDARVHFLVEKPTGRGSRDVADLLRRAEGADLVHAVDHEMRFGAVYRKLRDLVADGFVGDVRQASFSCFVDYGVRPDFPTFYHSFATLREHSGGVLRQLGSHYIDLIHYILGPMDVKGGYIETMVKERPPSPMMYSRSDDEDPTRSWVTAQRMIADATREGSMRAVDADDHSVMIGALENGAPLSFSIGWSAHHATGVRWDIFGSEGSLRFHSTLNEWGGDIVGARAGEPMEPIALPPEYDPSISMEDPRHMTQCFAMEIEDICRAIRGDRSGARFCTLADELAMWNDIERMETLRSE